MFFVRQRRESCEIKNIKERIKMPLMNHLKCQRLSLDWGRSVRFDTSLFFHKCKDGATKWTYHYIIHRCRGEMDLGALKDGFLTNHELAT